MATLLDMRYVEYPSDYQRQCDSTKSPTSICHSSHAGLGPGSIPTNKIPDKLWYLLINNDIVFTQDVSGYNCDIGPFESNVNMGPGQPPKRKDLVPRYARNKFIISLLNL